MKILNSKETESAFDPQEKTRAVSMLADALNADHNFLLLVLTADDRGETLDVLGRGMTDERFGFIVSAMIMARPGLANFLCFCDPDTEAEKPIIINYRGEQCLSTHQDMTRTVHMLPIRAINAIAARWKAER